MKKAASVSRARPRWKTATRKLPLLRLPLRKRNSSETIQSADGESCPCFFIFPNFVAADVLVARKSVSPSATPGLPSPTAEPPLRKAAPPSWTPSLPLPSAPPPLGKADPLFPAPDPPWPTPDRLFPKADPSSPKAGPPFAKAGQPFKKRVECSLRLNGLRRKPAIWPEPSPAPGWDWHERPNRSHVCGNSAPVCPL